MEVNYGSILNVRPTEGQATRYRWVIVALFSALSFMQLTIWSTWSPIGVSATEAIGFTPHDYDLLVNWLPIGVMITTPFVMWMVSKRGTRLPVIISSILLAAGSGLRCLPLKGRWKKYTIHIGQLLNAMAGGTIFCASPMISNVWFPPQERVLATSCMITLGNLGTAASFLIGPAVVELPNNCSGQLPNETSGWLWYGNCENNTSVIRKQIDRYMYGECGISVLVCLLIIPFFRNKPKVPPSASAAVQRLDTLAGLKSLSKQYSWWTACIVFSAVNAAIFGWNGVLTVILTPHGIPEKTVDYAGLVMTCTGSMMGIAAGWFSDRMKGRVKWILVGCYVAIFFSLLYMVIIVMKWIDFPPFQYTEGGFWTSIVIVGTLGMTIVPLGVELLVDMAYPASEGTSSSVVAWTLMVLMFAYLLVLNAVKNQDLANYLLLALIAVAAPVIAVSLTNENSRLNIDKNEEDLATGRELEQNGDDDFPISRVNDETDCQPLI